MSVQEGRVLLYGPDGRPIPQARADGAAPEDAPLVDAPHLYAGGVYRPAAAAAVMTDGDSGAQTAAVAMAGWDGAGWNRWRGNHSYELLALAERTQTTDTSTQTNHNCRGVILWFQITSVQGSSPTYALWVSDMNNEWFLRSGNLLAANGNYWFGLYPGIGSPAVGEMGSDIKSWWNAPLPREWRVRVVHVSGITSMTYRLNARMVV